jgi:hypothetical protein
VAIPSDSGRIRTPRSRRARSAPFLCGRGSFDSTARRAAARRCPRVCCRARASTCRSTWAVWSSERFAVSVSRIRPLARVIRPCSSAANVAYNRVRSDHASSTRHVPVQAAVTTPGDEYRTHVWQPSPGRASNVECHGVGLACRDLPGGPGQDSHCVSAFREEWGRAPMSVCPRQAHADGIWSLSRPRHSRFSVATVSDRDGPWHHVARD